MYLSIAHETGGLPLLQGGGSPQSRAGLHEESFPRVRRNDSKSGLANFDHTVNLPGLFLGNIEADFLQVSTQYSFCSIIIYKIISLIVSNVWQHLENVAYVCWNFTKIAILSQKCVQVFSSAFCPFFRDTSSALQKVCYRGLVNLENQRTDRRRASRERRSRLSF